MGKYYTTRDFARIRQDLFAPDNIPKTYVSGRQLDIHRLVINRDVKTTIRQVPAEGPALKAFMEQLKLPYCWEGTPATTPTALVGLN